MMRCLIMFVALVFAQVRAEMEQGCTIYLGEEEVYRYTGNEVRVCVTEMEQVAADPDKPLLSLHISKQGQSARLALTPTKLLRGDGTALLEGETLGTWHLITAEEAPPGSAPSGFSLRRRSDRSPESGDAPPVRLPADAEGLSFPYDPALIGEDYVLIHGDSVDALRMLLGAERFELVAGRWKISIPSTRGKTYAWLTVHAVCLLLLILSGAYIMRRHRAWAMLTLMLALIPGITCLSLWRSLNTDANLDARFVRECVWQKGADEPFLRLIVDDSAPHEVYIGSSADQGYTRFYISTVPAGHALQPLEVKQHGALRYIDLRFPSNYSSSTYVFING